MGLGRFDPIRQPALRRIRQNPAFAGSQRHPEVRCPVYYLSSFGDSLVSSIRENNLLLAMQQLGSRGEVMHVGGGDDHRMDQA